jgi:hypothetical protein
LVQVALVAHLLEQRPVQTVAILFFQLTLQQAAVAALAAVHRIPAEMADQAAAQEETRQAQVVLETRPLLAQVKEATVDQRHHFPAALEVAVQVRQEALELLAQIFKGVMAVMGRQTPSQAHPLLTLGVAAAVQILRHPVALLQQVELEAVEMVDCV